MSFEHELLNMDVARVESVIDVLTEQIRAGVDTSTIFPDELEDKYSVATYLGDLLRKRLMEDAEADRVDPIIAESMALGARIAITSLMEYAEAETFEEDFPDEL